MKVEGAKYFSKGLYPLKNLHSLDISCIFLYIKR